ncbi:MAG TPA: D-alanyl-D-alanine carboxypeptidase/D-alanyl-D-alanine-endopeptidase [Verrucomicrobiae bacterium]|jgi:D-alanyl-D-alanine carboxypeptidase/D-alanyl-D-alanine-endopeptidase (penicillin-binding protein 4)|nr:D-alanyl-D-alanine carboxypeptidase/D-alanyl-D-alanine-endopeptidase [Verrucomicrobiae bacterium]
MKRGRSLAGIFRIETFFAVLAICCLLGPFAARAKDITTLAELQQKISAFVSQPRFDGAIWGIKVVSLDTGKTLFETNAARLMSPASNCKMLTGAAALDRFGGDYQITTPIYASAAPNRRGTIHGDLIVVGHGDTTWNWRRFGTNNFRDIFEPFVSALSKAGIRHVTGDLIADATYFHGEPTGSSLMIDDFEYGECPYISAITLNDGLAQVQVSPTAVGAPCSLTIQQPDISFVFSNCTTTVAKGGRHSIDYYMPYGQRIIYVFGQLPVGDSGESLDIPVLDPAKWFAAALKDALARHGIKISGTVRGVTWPQTSVLSSHDVKIGEVLSPPLREVIRYYMKPSQNLENDTVLADLGEATRDSNTPPWRTSEQLGLAAIHQFLETNDLPADEVKFDEGSGLSDNNMATANAFAALLQFMWQHPASKDFIDSLPIAAQDGTLRRRFHNTPAAGNIRAKTGTLRWVNSLSGYMTSAAGEHLAFSLLLNRYSPPPGYDKRDELDAVALMLAEFSGRSIPNAAELKELYAPYGNVMLVQLPNAPFPHPSRAKGHWYGNQFYSARDHYSDNSVAIFIPKNFHATDKADFLVHFHGWRHTVAGTLGEYHLIDQLAASGKNVILVVPQGPFNVPDSSGGKLEDTNGFARFMNDVVIAVKNSGAVDPAANLEIGNIILSGHSGGYKVMASIVDHGGLSDKIKEVWLFDALYAGRENFVAWQKAENGRLLDIYTDHGGTEYEVADLISSLKKNGVPYWTGEDSAVTPEELRTNKYVILHSDMAHNDVVSKRQAFQKFLETSCLGDK